MAIDLGGSHATCAVVEDRVILAREELSADSAENLSVLLVRVLETFNRITSRVSTTFQECEGIAVGFPGLVSSRETCVLSTNAKYADAERLDLVAWARENLGLRLRIENDARMALLGEVYAGAAKGFGDAVMITLGTGIGGVAMIEGKLLQGKHSQAGCLGGHMPVLFSGRPCTCGGVGCAEAEAAGWSLPLVFADWPGARGSSLAKFSKLGFKELFEQAAMGDWVAIDIRDRCLKIWCATAIAMVHAYDPEIIVMGGGVMKSADLIVPAIQDHVRKHAWTPWGTVQVRAAELGNHAAILGAVPLLSKNPAV